MLHQIAVMKNSAVKRMSKNFLSKFVFQGFGTNEEALCEIICAQSSEVCMAITRPMFDLNLFNQLLLYLYCLCFRVWKRL
jgi:hypothetical protein